MTKKRILATLFSIYTYSPLCHDETYYKRKCEIVAKDLLSLINDLKEETKNDDGPFYDDIWVQEEEKRNRSEERKDHFNHFYQRGKTDAYSDLLYKLNYLTIEKGGIYITEGCISDIKKYIVKEIRMLEKDHKEKP